jgi:N-acetylmuramoyl-L-alanine amidase
MSRDPRTILLMLAPVAIVGAALVLIFVIPWPHMRHEYVTRIALPEAGTRIGLPKVRGPQDGSRPLIVIDAGHGGHDPGASGDIFREKDVVLSLALALRDQLLKQGGVRVALTREDDRFLALEERSQIARALHADLFLSIHADSAGQEADIGGASVYTLSAKASDDTAAKLASRENRSDQINGVSLEGRSDAVNAILVELSQRRTKEASVEFAHLITREGRGIIRFLPTAHRSAAFVVLKSPDVPSVLFEAGYITNPEDAARLTSREGKAGFAEAVARAVRVYFARTAGT